MACSNIVVKVPYVSASDF